MTRTSLSLILLLASASTATAAVATAPAPAAAYAAKPGTTDFPPIRQRNGILVDIKGRGLYTFGGDDRGKSNCSGQCILLWPPIVAEAYAKPKAEFTIIVREDGKRQWAWKGHPLYRWVSDKKRGDAGGDGVNGIWHLARVQPTVPHYAPEPVKKPL